MGNAYEWGVLGGLLVVGMFLDVLFGLSKFIRWQFILSVFFLVFVVVKVKEFRETFEKNFRKFFFFFFLNFIPPFP